MDDYWDVRNVDWLGSLTPAESENRAGSARSGRSFGP